MTVISSTELSLLRSRPHRTSLHLAIYRPTTIFSAQVNDSTAAKGYRVIHYQNATGDYTKIKNGMTMIVGTTPGGRDLGRLRTRSANGTTITVAENTDIDWSSGVYFSVLNFFELWGIYPRITLSSANIPTFYKDYDVTYTNQNEIFDPIPMMGPNRAVIIRSGVASSYFDGSHSYDLNASGTITSYLWSFEGATVTSSTAATPGNINWTTAGDYLVSLTVTNNSGKSFTAYRHVIIRDAPGGNNPPILNWGIENLMGDYNRGGWEAKIWMRQSADFDNVVDGALVVIFADDWYSTTQQSIGGNYPNLEKIVYVGYVKSGSVAIDPTTSLVSFETAGLADRLEISEVFSVSLQSVSTPTSWYQLKNMTVDKAVMHFFRWHTTVYLIADINKNGNTDPVQFADFSREPMYSAVDGFLQSTLLAHLVFDRQGQGWTEKKIDLIPIEDRNPGSSLTLTRADWRDRLNIQQRREDVVAYVEVGGILYEGPASGQFFAVISSAPGSAPKYQGSTRIINGLVQQSQDASNQLAGNILADQNRIYYDIRIPLSGDYRIFDIAPQERVKITLTVNDNYLGLVWLLKNVIPRSVNFQYDRAAQVLLVDIGCDEETDGPAGVTGPYLPVPPDDPLEAPLPDTPPLPPISTLSTVDLVYVAVDDNIGRSRNFTS